MTNAIVVLKLVTNIVCSTNMTADVKDRRMLERETVAEIRSDGSSNLVARIHRKYEFVDNHWKLINSRKQLIR
jgi:hypothetical protein